MRKMITKMQKILSWRCKARDWNPPGTSRRVSVPSFAASSVLLIFSTALYCLLVSDSRLIESLSSFCLYSCLCFDYYSCCYMNPPSFLQACFPYRYLAVKIKRRKKKARERDFYQRVLRTSPGLDKARWLKFNYVRTNGAKHSSLILKPLILMGRANMLPEAFNT